MAEALGAHIAGTQSIIGSPTACEDDDWRQSLRKAQKTLSDLQSTITAGFGRGHIPLIVANTCSASLVSLPVVARERADAIVLWIDAHGDFNTPETTASGYLGGMVLAAACGLWESGHGAGLSPGRVIVVGARDVDEAEGKLLQQAGVRVIPPARANAEAIRRMIGDAPVWIHVDWDVLEPGFVPAAYKVPDGLLPEQIRAILAIVPPEQIAGVELAEFEATGDKARNDKALATILHVMEPLLAMR
ncbi:arginase family protein [Tropicimonas sp.]|uniref:arginase family protein n=1 Tax=Tropicimonas sp. TaxID=2067044 RepID=UPI003A845D8E